MPSLPHRILLVIALLPLLGTVMAAEKACATCGKRIAGRYVTANGRAYCSQDCFHQTLPLCDVCQKRLTGRYVTSGDRKFCSQECFHSTLSKCEICQRPLTEIRTINGRNFCPEHAAGPACHNCGLPFAEGLTLADGRQLCGACRPAALFEVEPAMQYYRQARVDLQKLTGCELRQIPRLELVGIDQLQQLLGAVMARDPGLDAHGFYKRSETTQTKTNAFGKVLEQQREVKKRIFIAYGLSPTTFFSTAVHEFTHDLIAEHFPKVKESPLWLQEGICQYLSATICRRYGYARELEAIEDSPDAIYGDGYRYVKQRFGDDNWPALQAWMSTLDPAKLAAQAK